MSAQAGPDLPQHFLIGAQVVKYWGLSYASDTSAEILILNHLSGAVAAQCSSSSGDPEHQTVFLPGSLVLCDRTRTELNTEVQSISCY